MIMIRAYDVSYVV